MELIADIILGAGAIGAGFYCFILGRRLNRFNDLENGVGGAVAVLSAQVDDLGKTLTAAQAAAAQSAQTLTSLVERAEDTARVLEMQMASLHDLPQTQASGTQDEPTEDVAITPSADPQDPAQPMFVRRRA